VPHGRSRKPLRWLVREGVRSPWPAPYRPATSSAISRSVTPGSAIGRPRAGCRSSRAAGPHRSPSLEQLAKGDLVDGHRGLLFAGGSGSQPDPTGAPR
jgi:hypothetical protein